MPYPRRPLPILPQNSQNPQKRLRGKYSPTDFTDAHRWLGCVLPPNLCVSVQSVGVFLGGYGILPYPRHPPRGCSCPSCTNQANRAYPPTDFTEFTETTGEEYSPTDFTDAHRWLGCVGFSHRIRRTHRSDW